MSASICYILRVTLLQLRQAASRTVLTVAAVALAVCLWVAVQSFAASYQESLGASIRSMGYEALVTVKGCPYETASLVLQGGNIPMFVNEAIFKQVAADPSVARATRFLMRAVPDATFQRIRVFMGVDESFFPMKPWVTLQQGRWFQGPEADEAVVGYGAAERLRLNIGDEVEALPGGPKVKVVGILDRCGGQDDGTLFVPLYRAQRLFDKKDQLSGVGVKLKSLDQLEPFATRINELPSVQVISLPQVQTTIFRLLRTGRFFALGTAAVAVLVALISVVNAVLMSVIQRRRQLAIMRVLGASQGDLFTLVLGEAVALCLLGGVAGIVLAALLGPAIRSVLSSVLPFAPDSVAGGVRLSAAVAACLGVILLGLLAGTYPGWRAGRIAPAVAMRE